MTTVAAKAARSRALRARSSPNAGQLAFCRKRRYDPQPPVPRQAATALPPLNASERVQERLEERRFKDGWRARKDDGGGFRGV